ncbi:MAG TPA: amidohydrolase family protein [Dehalococcoidia bacterium]|nr:amidohydrolase family protein [Dehalococcoidia bacterium]
MTVIDADTHVDECEATWQSLEGGPHARYIPATLTIDPRDAGRMGIHVRSSRRWLVEGRLQTRATRDANHHPARERRELEDVPGRVQHMDEMGVDVQIVFPTFFIRYDTSNPEAELALTTAYNHWLAERCACSNGRLRWAAVLPLMQPAKAVEELRWAKDHGACGIFKRGFDLNRSVSDPHFFPVYEEASALDMPICIHTGHPGSDPGGDRGVPIMAAFTAIVSAGLATKFPGLRFGLIEAGASWVPYSVSQLRAQERTAQERGTVQRPAPDLDLVTDLFRANRLFVTVDATDDIAYLLDFGLEDSLMIGTDYSHSDISANAGALAEVRLWARQGRISEAVAHKILQDNPRAFYSLH